MPGSGFDIVECDSVEAPDGSFGPPTDTKVLAVVRDGRHQRVVGDIRPGDRLAVVGRE